MILSMTGFGSGRVECNQHQITTEISAVNHRFLGVSVKLPQQLSGLEQPIRQELKSRLSRGKVVVSVWVERVTPASRISVDRDVVAAYLDEVRSMAAELGLADDLSISSLITLPGVFSTELDLVLEELAPAVEESVQAALEDLNSMRAREGQELAEEIAGQTKKLEELIEKVEVRAPAIVEEYRNRLRDRIAELCEDITVSEERIAVEVAFAAERSDVSEELARLKSHLKQFQEMLESSGPVGRKLDFLCQEMHREINTIGSKTRDGLATAYVIDAKTELEKVREQVQNIE